MTIRLEIAKLGIFAKRQVLGRLVNVVAREHRFPHIKGGFFRSTLNDKVLNVHDTTPSPCLESFRTTQNKKRIAINFFLTSASLAHVALDGETLEQKNNEHMNAVNLLRFHE